MGRSGFLSLMSAIARESARHQRQAIQQAKHTARIQLQAARQSERQAALAQRANTTSQKAAEKAAKERYLADRTAEAEVLNTQLEATLSELSAVLTATLTIDDTIAFQTLHIPVEQIPFSPPPELSKPQPGPDRQQYFLDVREPSGLAALVPGARKRYEEAVRDAEDIFEAACREHERAESERCSKLLKLKSEHERMQTMAAEKATQRNREVEDLESAYRRGDSDAIETYNSMVLERSAYPEGFPQEFRLAYVAESKQLAVEYQLPGPEIIPTVQEYRYSKTRDAMEVKPRKASDCAKLYQDVVASVALRTLHEVFEADQANQILVVVFNGFVRTVDPATGTDIQPCLISVRVIRERFNGLDLSRISKSACLRNLGAQVSQSPNEMVAVKPIVEFDMFDKRFVDQGNILGALESRPNLMDLKPFEFETLVANLFQQMGIESKLTRSSRDGGVDVVGFDKRPILGGKVVIQAKRYRHTVGVSAVRDLYGTMMNEGANKGLLVTTSGYGPDAFEFSKDKPIELIDGGGLLYLLEQAGTSARIIMPADPET